MRKFFLLLTFLTLLLSNRVLATHNRAGEITYTRVSGLTYRITVTTYTESESPADRCRLEVKWGDGKLDTIPRINGNPITGCPYGGEMIASNIRKNVYEGLHTYSGPGIFKISVTDPNRNAGIINIPGSVNIPFYIESKLVVSPFLGDNSSPILLNPPIDNACIGKIFIHNPGAYDPDGKDSIGYELIGCRGDQGNLIAGYYIPAGVTLNMETGDLVWNAPNQIGEFNFAILIKEYRNGTEIGFVVRDMQVTVGNCRNDPPVLTVRDTCVEANTTLTFNVSATDPNADDVLLSSTGAPYLLANSPATFTSSPLYTQNPTGVFNWPVTCGHVKKLPYTVTFKAEDDAIPENLANLVTMRITVVSPAPKFLTATPAGSSVRLDWQPTVCSNALGYKIYRRNGSTGFVPVTCETGVPGSLGYTLIAAVAGSGSNNYIDNDGGNGLVPGMEYCYIIHAYFQDGAESYASNETCTELKKDVPVITNVSVVNTHGSAGSDTIIWSKPTDMDPSITGPFRYLIYHSPEMSGSSFTLIDSLNSLDDTIYYHQNINTFNTANSYKIDLYTLSPVRTRIGGTRSASSIFLSVSPSDNMLTLNWSFDVPWENYKYYIYKQDGAGVFNLLDSTTSQSYADAGLINGREYCYYVIGHGEYSGSGFAKPLINKSQISCGRPKDMTAPCSPKLTIKPDCDLVQNFLIWNNPNNSCADDVVKYKIYYKTTDDTAQAYEFLTTIESSTDTDFVFLGSNSIAGCYVITALDSFDNESVRSEAVCVDNCPIYELPNVFTPNGDGQNDLFIPLPYRYVESIDIRIYNRWGNELFHSTDPDINWNGKNQQNKQLPDGVYYYVCQVNEIRLSGIVPRYLKGFVHLYNVPAPQTP